MKKRFLFSTIVLFGASVVFCSCEKKKDEGITVTYANEAGSGNNPNRRETSKDAPALKEELKSKEKK